MNIIHALPPNFADIDAVFHIRRMNRRGILYCFGTAIYNPDRVFVPAELLEHEQVHSRQQAQTSPERWWGEYLARPQFRLEQEIEAHRAEWRRYVADNHPRTKRRAYIAFMAERLSGPMYGRMLTKDQAKREITGEVDA